MGLGSALRGSKEDGAAQLECSVAAGIRFPNMRIGIGIGQGAIGQPDSLDKLVADTRRADADGFTTAWFVNIWGPDAMTTDSESTLLWRTSGACLASRN